MTGRASALIVFDLSPPQVCVLMKVLIRPGSVHLHRRTEMKPLQLVTQRDCQVSGSFLQHSVPQTS